MFRKGGWALRSDIDFVLYFNCSGVLLFMYVCGKYEYHSIYVEVTASEM